MRSQFVVPSFAFIAFCPVWFGDNMSRIYRDGFLAAIAFWVIGLLLHLTNEIVKANKLPHFEKKLFQNLGFRSFFGFIYSVWFITKPSTQPLTMATIVLLLLLILKLRNITSIALVLVFTISSFVGYLPLKGYVEFQNNKHYGVSITENFYSGYFSKALTLMTRVEPVSTRRYVAVTNYMRQNMYAASPEFQKLRPWLEYDPGEGWRTHVCNSPIKVCDESTAMFQWELRDAAEHAGLANSAGEFENTFATIYRQILSACSSGQLTCLRTGFMPADAPLLNQVPPRDLIEFFFEGIQLIWNLSPASKGPSPYFPNVDPVTLSLWNETVNDLPQNIENPIYKPAQNNAGSSFALLRQMYEIIWPLALLLTVIGLIYLFACNRANLFLMFSVSMAASIIPAVASLGLLEASIGRYISGGGPLYSISIFPFVLILVICVVAGISNYLETIRLSKYDV